MTSIGLFGGTFDPVHNGHVSIAHSFLQSGLITELWVLLTPFPPHKIHEKHVPYESRLKLLQKAFDGVEGVRILTIENTLPRPSYTYKTIEYLEGEYPDHRYFFCMGEDSLANFHKWKFYDRILDYADLIVARRPGENHDHVQPDILQKVHFVDHQPVEMASSDVRDRIAAGKDVTGYLPPKVLEIIDKEQLYR